MCDPCWKACSSLTALGASYQESQSPLRFRSVVPMLVVRVGEMRMVVVHRLVAVPVSVRGSRR